MIKLTRDRRFPSGPRIIEEILMRSCIALFVSAFILSFVLPAPSDAHGYELGSLKIHHPWTRATPKGADVAGGFITIQNQGTTDDRLAEIRVDGVKRTELHEMANTNGMMTMRPLKDGIVLPAGKTVELKPGGFHAMMMGLASPFLEGDRIKATLRFEKAGTIDIEFSVEAQGASAKHSDMNHTPQN